tara:strand:+ start:451 stop:561 length:111 start_codon:yes stop_codon:yes gene_type:complete
VRVYSFDTYYKEKKKRIHKGRIHKERIHKERRHEIV